MSEESNSGQENLAYLQIKRPASYYGDTRYCKGVAFL